MKYAINKSGVFGYDYIIYDTETLTRTCKSGCGQYGSEQVKTMTIEEMRQFINDRELEELKNYHYEMAKLQQKYEEILVKIQKFKKALDND